MKVARSVIVTAIVSYNVNLIGVAADGVVEADLSPNCWA